jgi:hypothetical protein
MNIQEIKELLANPSVRQVVEEQINEQVKDKQASLTKKMEDLAQEAKKRDKEAFLLKKTILAKANLFESKLKDYYEGKFQEAKKRLTKETYDFINESVASVVKKIELDAKNNTKAAKLEEAFSLAMRNFVPYVNINELTEANSSKIDELTKRVNELVKENKQLAKKAFNGELHELVVSECAGYPVDKMAVIYKTVTKMAPTTLVEGKQAIEAVKLALKQKEAEAAQIVESAAAKKSNQEAPARARLKAMAQEIKNNKETASKAVVEERASMVSAGSYDIYLGD